jgi:hypothetical protein
MLSRRSIASYERAVNRIPRRLDGFTGKLHSWKSTRSDAWVEGKVGVLKNDARSSRHRT